MLNMSVANACIRGSLFELDEPPSIPGRAEAVHTLQLHQLPLQTQDAPRQLIAIEDAPEWSESAVVQLHWVLLQELRKLTDPETPLEEKIETLDWATAQLFLIPTTELDRRRQAIRNQLGDDARVQRQLAYLHESLSIRLRDAYVRRLGIDPADTSDLRPQILVGLYLSLATEVSGRSQSPEETRQRWLASLRSLL